MEASTSKPAVASNDCKEKGNPTGCGLVTPLKAPRVVYATSLRLFCLPAPLWGRTAVGGTDRLSRAISARPLSRRRLSARRWYRHRHPDAPPRQENHLEGQRTASSHQRD